MAFFKFRFPGKGGATDGRRRTTQPPKGLVRKSPAAQTESVESLRQRARHRVIGAAVLVLLAVIGFPMVFDTEPRPVGHVPLEVPGRNEVSITPGHMAPIVRVPHEESLLDNEEVVGGPVSGGMVGAVAGAAAGAGLAAQAQQATPQAAQQAAVQQEAAKAAQAAQERAAENERLAEQNRIQREQAAREKAAKDKADREKAAREKAAKDKADREKRQAEERKERQAEERRERQAEERKERQAKERVDRAEREKTDRAKTRDSDAGRFVIQVGSFADEGTMRTARTKLERAGISTYIQVITARDGTKRTRVRVGPFGSRAEAEAAAKRVQALGLYAGIAEI